MLRWQILASGETALAIKTTEYITPKKIAQLERHLFRQVSQEPGEAVASLLQLHILSF